MTTDSRFARLKLDLRLAKSDDSYFLEIDFVNRSNGPITVVTLPRYFPIDMTNEHRQFIRGERIESASLSLPTAADYLNIAPGAIASSVVRLPIARTMISERDYTYTIGDFRFLKRPPKTTVRIVYKTDPILPNLSSKQKSTFFGGPLDSPELVIDL